MYSLILLAGGTGSRMNNPVPKQYMLLAGKPVIMHTLERIEMIEEIDEIIIVCCEKYIESNKLMLQQYNIRKPVKFALSGNTRQASVKSGLDLAKNNQVIIHEAARPFVKTEEFCKLINEKFDNVIMGAPINYTVLRGAEKVEGTLVRSELINVQLPQKFNKKTLLEAHEKAERDGRIFTEDASLMFAYDPSVEIRIVQGTEQNIKLTTPTDMIVGKVIYDEFFTRGL